MKKILLCGIVSLLLILGGFLIGRKTGGARNQEPTIITQRDTILQVITDTIRTPAPEPKIVEVIRIDTIFVTDTACVPVPIERKLYQDSTYQASVTGYKVQLDWVEVYPKTITHTITEVQTQVQYKYIPKRWGIGLSFGYGVTTADFRLSPYIGLSLNYNLISW